MNPGWIMVMLAALLFGAGWLVGRIYQLTNDPLAEWRDRNWH